MRIDSYLSENGYFSSRSKAAIAIKRGLVTVNGQVVSKVSLEVSTKDEIKLLNELKFVSQGGYKLDKAITDFDLEVSGLIFADIGASTGGFTDCLLQRGAKKVYAVDVGENQLDATLFQSEKVVVMDKTNARYLELENFDEKLDGIVVDCSFISLKTLLPTFDRLLNDGIVLALIKPQFECGKKFLGKSGILKDKKIRQQVVLDVISAASTFGFFVKGLSKAPERDGKNIEYVVYFDRTKSLISNAKLLEVLAG